MEFIAIYYNNIGPFGGKELTIHFSQGNFLIQAPIGSGKSFLFFDGPSYALYKDSARKMLHTGAKTGDIILHFCIHDQEYIIHRKLKQGKAKDNCQSTLYIVKTTHTRNIQDAGIVWGYNFFSKIKDLEEIVCKNESDVQQVMLDMLPPKEVFLSTHMLMQGADNIFSVGPSERLEVFKNVFNLLSIDEGKEILRDKKKELATKIKVYSDHSDDSQKLQKNLDTIIQLRNTWSQIQNTHVQLNRPKDHIFTQWLEDIHALIDKISLQDLEIPDRESHMTERQNIITTQIQNRRSREEHNQILLQHSNALISEHKDIQDRLEKLVKEKVDIEQIIATSGEDNIAILQKEKDALLVQRNILLNNIPKDIKQTYAKLLASNSYVSESMQIEDRSIQDIKTLAKSVEQVISMGTLVKTELLRLEEKKSHLVEQRDQHTIKIQERSTDGKLSQEYFSQRKKNAIQQKEHALAILKEQYINNQSRYNEIKETYEKQKADLDTFIKERQGATTFFCEKISHDCPFVAQINTKSIKQLETQKNRMEKDLEEIHTTYTQHTYRIQGEKQKKDIASLLEEIDAYKKKELQDCTEVSTYIKQKQDEIIKTSQNKDTDNLIHTIIQEHTKLTKYAEALREYLITIDRKQIKEDIDIIDTLETQSITIEKKILDETKKQEHIREKKEVLASINGQYIAISEQAKQIKDKHTKAIVQQEEHTTKKPLGTIEVRNNAQSTMQSIIIRLSSCKELLADFQKKQVAVKSMQEEEKRVNELYNLFNKELLLLVLEHALPSLTACMNAYLMRIVNYHLDMHVKLEDDKVTLEVDIIASDGRREVKSLSGGQKVILKLVWMFAIAGFMRTKMLFLDETINNLDNDTVGLVAKLLRDFAKDSDMQLYVVTHAEQIQHISMRDQTIDITQSSLSL